MKYRIVIDGLLSEFAGGEGVLLDLTAPEEDAFFLAFERLFGLLVPANQAWCKRAGALFCLVSRQVLDSGRPSSSASLDAGAAWMSLALQASAMGLVVHAMGGYDAARARTELAVPADHKPECMIAVGHPGSVDDLPEDLRAREKPSDRKPIASLVFEGTFPPGPPAPIPCACASRPPRPSAPRRRRCPRGT